MNVNRSRQDLDGDRESIVEASKRKRSPTDDDESENYDLTQPKLQRRMSGMGAAVLGDDGLPPSNLAGKGADEGSKPTAGTQHSGTADVQVHLPNQGFSPPLTGHVEGTNDALVRQALMSGGSLTLGSASSLLQQGGAQTFSTGVPSRRAPIMNPYCLNIPGLLGGNVQGRDELNENSGFEEQLSTSTVEAGAGVIGATGAGIAPDQSLLNQSAAALFSQDQLLAARARLLQEAQRNSQVQMANMLTAGLPGSLNPADPAGRSLMFPNPAMVEAQTRANLLFLQNQMMAIPPHLQLGRQPHQLAMLGAGAHPLAGRFGGGGPTHGTVPNGAGNQEPTVLPQLEPGQHPPVNLYMSCDDEILSDHQIFLRKQIEYFEAGTVEVQSATHGRRREIHMGQVGIRCKHCAAIPPRRRPKGAVYYPASLRALYQAAQNMAAGHFSSSSCEMISEEKRAQFKSFQAGKISAGHGGKKYWSDCAKAVRIYETEKGLRFAKDPDSSSESTSN